VVSELFADQTMIKQHQGVMSTLSEPLASGRLHAVTLKTFTPEAWAEQQAPANPGLLQIQI
jgi:monothiol glutaredoxin